MTEREALKLALELRELADKFSEGWHDGIKIDASDIMLLTNAAEALAEQPAPVAEPRKQEPVATVTSESGHPDVTMSWWHEPALPVGTPLYTLPPQRTWVGLDLDERAACYKASGGNLLKFADQIEAKLKEKNT